MSRCRSCTAPIVWVRTVRGARMPLDATPVPTGPVALDHAGRAHVLGKDGSLATHVKVSLQAERWMPHHATCPEAGSWRG